MSVQYAFAPCQARRYEKAAARGARTGAIGHLRRQDGVPEKKKSRAREGATQSAAELNKRSGQVEDHQLGTLTVGEVQRSLFGRLDAVALREPFAVEFDRSGSDKHICTATSGELM